MNALLLFRERLERFYSEFDVYIRPVLKFVLALGSFYVITTRIGYMSVLNNLFVLLVLAVICAILPINGIVAIGIVLIVANCFGLGVEAGAFAFVLYILMILLYFRFVPKDALAMILTPAAFILHSPVLVPMALGMTRGPISALTVIFGVISWKFIDAVDTTLEPLISARDASMLDTIQAIPKALVSTDVIMLIITCVVVFLVIVSIRKLLGTHSWEIGIIAGAVIYMSLTIAGSYILNVQIDLKQEIIGTVISAVSCLILEFFLFNADYTESEYLQFEDDKNYYYVHVIPKRKPAYDMFEPEEEEEEMFDGASENKFIERDAESEIERKFDGINLQSKLEESLKTLNTNQSGRENSGTSTIYQREIPPVPPAEADDNPEAGETRRI